MALIKPTVEYMLELQNLIQPEEVLQKLGFVTRPLSEEELQLKRRCDGCGKSNCFMVRQVWIKLTF